MYGKEFAFMFFKCKRSKHILLCTFLHWKNICDTVSKSMSWMLWYRSMMPSICLRTSCALFSVRTWTKFS